MKITLFDSNDELLIEDASSRSRIEVYHSWSDEIPIVIFPRYQLSHLAHALQKANEQAKAQQQLRDEESKLRRWNMNAAKAKANKILGISKEGAK